MRRAFPDGIFWITLGQKPQLAERQRWLARELGDEALFPDERSGKECLRNLLAGRKVLLVLDDVWQREHAEADCRAMWLAASGARSLRRHGAWRGVAHRCAGACASTIWRFSPLVIWPRSRIGKTSQRCTQRTVISAWWCNTVGRCSSAQLVDER